MRPVSSTGIDRIAVTFDDPNLVANAGLLLVATLVRRLGLECLCNTTIRLSGRTGGFQPGRKILTLVHAMVAGATHINHADMLRAGSTGKVLPHRVMAPSTLGTFLRAFTLGHVRQFEKVIGDTLERAWSLGAGPGANQLVVDIDSTIREVFGKLKEGAAYGYTKVLGYHPILATRADTDQVLHARMRKGSANTARGTKRFVEEQVARLRRAGATGRIIMRFDSGYWSNETIKVLTRLEVSYTMAVRTGTKAIDRDIAEIPESNWVSISTPPAERRWWPRPPTRDAASSCAAPPPRRSPGELVAQLAALRLLERPCGRHGGARRFPPPSRRRRAVHRRLGGGCGHGALPFW